MMPASRADNGATPSGEWPLRRLLVREQLLTLWGCGATTMKVTAAQHWNSIGIPSAFTWNSLGIRCLLS